MFGQAEHPTVVDADAFKHSVSIQQAVVKHGDFRLGFRDDLAIEINKEVCRHEQPRNHSRAGFASAVRAAGYFVFITYTPSQSAGGGSYLRAAQRWRMTREGLEA